MVGEGAFIEDAIREDSAIEIYRLVLKVDTADMLQLLSPPLARVVRLPAREVPLPLNVATFRRRAIMATSCHLRSD